MSHAVLLNFADHRFQRCLLRSGQQPLETLNPLDVGQRHGLISGELAVEPFPRCSEGGHTTNMQAPIFRLERAVPLAMVQGRRVEATIRTDALVWRQALYHVAQSVFDRCGVGLRLHRGELVERLPRQRVKRGSRALQRLLVLLTRQRLDHVSLEDRHDGALTLFQQLELKLERNVHCRAVAGGTSANGGAPNNYPTPTCCVWEGVLVRGMGVRPIPLPIKPLFCLPTAC